MVMQQHFASSPVKMHKVFYNFTHPNPNLGMWEQYLVKAWKPVKPSKHIVREEQTHPEHEPIRACRRNKYFL